MWPSRNNKNKNNNGSCSSSLPSKSPSSCSSPSSPGTPNKRSMEEVWQDISLTSLQYHSNNAIPNTTNITNTTTTTTTADFIFQDFFARPFNKDPPPTKASASASASVSLSSELSNNSCFGPLAPHHGTSLSLNSGSGFHFLENILSHDHHHQRRSQPAQILPCIRLKSPHENGDRSNDRRYKRMMKNRESASRSRARKQAYTTELEQEVAHLEKENAKLRRQQEQLLTASRVPKKHTLYRTSTAPF